MLIPWQGQYPGPGHLNQLSGQGHGKIPAAPGPISGVTSHDPAHYKGPAPLPGSNEFVLLTNQIRVFDAEGNLFF